MEESPGNLIQNNPNFFDDYSIIIGTQLSEQDSIALDAICRRSNIPVVYARTYGLSGMLRVRGIMCDIHGLWKHPSTINCLYVVEFCDRALCD